MHSEQLMITDWSFVLTIVPYAAHMYISTEEIIFKTLFSGFIITGASTFMSKYLERQFSVAPSKANMLIGEFIIPPCETNFRQILDLTDASSRLLDEF